MSACHICWQPNGSHLPNCPVPVVRLYGPLIPATTANRLPAPTDHTAAIAEAAREYVDFALSPHWEQGEHTKKLEVLIAAVDAERADLERGEADHD